MKTKSPILLILGTVLSFSISFGNAFAQDQDRDQEKNREQTQQQLQVQDQDKMVYGWELMSAKERKEFREKMRSLKTEEERTALREEHHKLMQQRAKEKGVTLPAKPLQGNRGLGPNYSSGGGAGKGR